MAGAGLSPHRCSAGGSRKEGPAGGVTLPTALEARQSVLGSREENAHSPEDSGQAHPTLATGNGRRFLGQPRGPAAVRWSQTTPKGTAASTRPFHKTPLHTGQGDPAPHCPEVPLYPTFFLCPLLCAECPAPTGGHAGGAAFACWRELIRRMRPT